MIHLEKKPFRSGFAAILGRPNVGKSTLMNALVGEKLAIVSPLPQTTRNRIMGICQLDDAQLVLLDTPGLHEPRTRLGTFMQKAAMGALDGADAIVIVLDASYIGAHDEAILEQYAKAKLPKAIALNKIDLLEKPKLLEKLAKLGQYGYDEIVPLSAKSSDGVEQLKAVLAAMLPEGPQYFPSGMYTDQPERVIIAELIREKALHRLRQEIPHGLGVEIMQILDKGNGHTDIHATIHCERDSHKPILLGKQGSMLRSIGTEARVDIEKLLASKVNLQLWIKVTPDWRNSAHALRDLGYDDKQ